MTFERAFVFASDTIASKIGVRVQRLFCFFEENFFEEAEDLKPSSFANQFFGRKTRNQQWLNVVFVRELAFRTVVPATELESKPGKDVEYVKALENQPLPSNVATVKALATDEFASPPQSTSINRNNVEYNSQPQPSGVVEVENFIQRL